MAPSTCQPSPSPTFDFDGCKKPDGPFSSPPKIDQLRVLSVSNLGHHEPPRIMLYAPLQFDSQSSDNPLPFFFQVLPGMQLCVSHHLLIEVVPYVVFPFDVPLSDASAA